MEMLSGHVSPDTAYVVDDYPYGFRLRCKIRYWLEFHPQHGTRFVSQTTNPKRAGDPWNTPKRSTYARIAGVMIRDNVAGTDIYVSPTFGHVSWVGLTQYSTYAESLAWAAKYAPGVEDGEPLARLNTWLYSKKLYEEARNAADAKHVAGTCEHFTEYSRVVTAGLDKS